MNDIHGKSMLINYKTDMHLFTIKCYVVCCGYDRFTLIRYLRIQISDFKIYHSLLDALKELKVD